MEVSYLYRCIASLNSTGVSLLESGCYEQAMLCFKESVALLKLSVGAQKDAAHLVFLARTYACRFLTRGLWRLSHQKKRTLLPSTPIFVSTATVGELPPATDAALNGSRCVVRPLRIEPAEEQEVQDRDWDLLAALVLHNLALSYHCLSKTTSNSTDATRLLLNAQITSSIAHSVLVTQRTDCDDEFFLLELLQVEVTLVTAYLQQLGGDREAQEFRRHIVSLQSMMEDLSVANDVLTARSNVAPAA